MSFAVDPAALEQLQNMGLSTEDATECLKACNNEPDRAAGYYFDGELEKSRKSIKWDDSVWAEPREGKGSSPNDHSYQNNWQSDFLIQGEDVLSPAVFAEGTKSRPPSPAASFRCRGQSPTDVNDPDLAKALAASMQGAQENGITGTTTSPINPNFLPAQENKDYDPRQWALTTTETTHEITREPPPEDRKRLPGCPAFLKPSFASNNLSSALTILHSVPRARSALLCRDHVLPDYGRNSRWWNGEKIRSSRIIDIENERLGFGEAEEEMSEVQRLIAFLDSTDRAYGSVDVLSDMPRVRENEQTGVLSQFFKGWNRCISDVCNEHEEFNSVFVSSAYQITPEGEERCDEFQVLDVSISPEDTTIYSALDNMIWSDEENSVVVNFAEVFCVHLKTEFHINGGQGIEIPAVLYPDRYTRLWLDTVKSLREQISVQKARIANLDSKEARLKLFKSRNNEYNPKSLLEITISHFATSLRINNDDGPDDIMMDSQPELPDPTPLLKELLRKLEKNLLNLERQRQEAQDVLSKLGRTFTSPEDSEPGLPPLTKYTLRGVCPYPSLTYVLLPVEEPENLLVTMFGEQWWKLEWHVTKELNSWGETNFGSYMVDKVEEEEVLAAARTLGENVLLVYANDAAFNVGEQGLPEPLKDFVVKDNAAFAAELDPSISLPSITFNASPEKKRRQECMDDEEMMGDQSPKRSVGSARSSATLSPATPQDSPHDSSSDLIDVSTVSNLLDGHEPELPPQFEMKERDGGTMRAFAMDTRVPDTDDDMPDIEHVEQSPIGWQQRGG